MNLSKTSAFTKGSRCGFEGCPSTFYFEDNGFKFCKNGHRQEVGRNSLDKLNRNLLL